MVLRKKYPYINYTSRDFNSIKNDLVEYAKRYYPDTFQDFGEAGFGALMLDTVAYIGDVLSFYLDFNVNESFLDTALDFDNVVKIGKQLGYKFKGANTSYGTADFYAVIPATSTGLGPDSSYFPFLRRGTQAESTSGVNFILNEDVSFGNSSNEVVVARVNTATGTPTHYAVKASGQVISGQIRQETFEIGEFQKFLKIRLSGDSISKIISIVDSAGNEYTEVDYLSQDVIFKALKNYDPNKLKNPSILKPVVVPRRYTVDQLANSTFIQFGGSRENDTSYDSLTDPSRTVLNFHAKQFISDLSFDPTNLLGTPSLGVAPSNTTITVTYRQNTQDTVNVSANGLSRVIAPVLDFEDINQLDATKVADIVSSLEVSNEYPINGDVTLPDNDELKIRVYDSFSAQRRAVTQKDYINMVYSMPPEFGAVKRVNIKRDPDSFKRNLNMYVISESEEGFLESANDTIKNNLKTWINESRMINDTIDIIDAKIVNIGIEFDVVGEMDVNKFEILSNCISSLEQLYINKMEIGEPFFITDIYNNLNSVDGVVDTTSVKIIKKEGIGYSETRFNLDVATSADGRYINVPDNVVMEIKFPSQDIRGSVK